METFIQWVERLARVATTPALIGLILSLGVVLTARRWPLQVVGMAGMYAVVGVLHARVIRPEVVLVKLLVGAVVCLALAATGRSAVTPSESGENENENYDEARPPGWRGLFRKPLSLADDIPLRGFALLAAFMIAYAGSLRFPLPQVPFFVGLSCYLLGVVGLFLSGMAEEPLPVGVGLLIFLNGFDLFFGALEPSILVAGLLGMVQLLVTLAVSYLTLTREPEGERG